jgi:hypothetical protein
MMDLQLSGISCEFKKWKNTVDAASLTAVQKYNLGRALSEVENLSDDCTPRRTKT